jgi:hypothetical protein
VPQDRISQPLGTSMREITARLCGGSFTASQIAPWPMGNLRVSEAVAIAAGNHV